MTDLLQLLCQTDALQKGHFELSSGRHSDTYVQCAKLLQWPEHTNRVTETLAKLLPKDSADITLGPAYGGIILAHAMAYYLDSRALFTERVGGVVMLRRGFVIQPGEKVVITEDVITTGISTQEVIQLVKVYGGIVTAVVSLIDRSESPIDFGVPQHSLLKLASKSWDPADCLLCANNAPITRPGSRKNV